MDLQEYIDNTEAIDRSDDEELSVAQYFKIDGAQGRVGIIRAGSREYEEDLRRVKPILGDEEALEDIFYKIKTRL